MAINNANGTTYISLTDGYLTIDAGESGIGAAAVPRAIQIIADNLEGGGSLEVDAFGNLTVGTGSDGYAGYNPIYNVKEFGAKGDGVTDDTAAIQAALNYSPFQGSLGGQQSRVYFPAGNYLVSAADGYPCLYINNHSVIMEGAGIAQGDGGQGYPAYGATIVAKGGAAILLIENGYTNTGTLTGVPGFCQLRNINFNGNGKTPYTLDGIINHVGSTVIEDCCIQYVSRYGFINESGDPGPGGGLIGCTLLPTLIPALYCDADNPSVKRLATAQTPPAWQAFTAVTASFIMPAVGANVSIQVGSTTNFPANAGFPLIIVGNDGILPTTTRIKPGTVFSIVSIDSATQVTIKLISDANANGGNRWPPGTTVTNVSVQIGASILCHGSDGDVGVFELCNNLDSQFAFIDASLGGNTWIQCYSQATQVGYFHGSAAGARFFSCGSEDYFPYLQGSTGQNGILIGGAIAGFAATYIPGNNLTIIDDAASSQVAFGGIGDDGYLYGMNIPANNNTIFNANSPFSFARKTPAFLSQLNMQYYTNPIYPFTQNSWQLVHGNGPELSYEGEHDIGIFGFTDPGSPYGGGLFQIGYPTMNTLRHWKWSQTVNVVDGYNIVYLKGGVGVDGGAVANFANSSLCLSMDQTIAHGNAPPATFIGGILTTQAPTNQFLVGINSGGTFPAATPTFYYSLNGSVIETGINMVSSHTCIGAAVGAFIEFPAGTYDTSQTWTAVPLWGQAQTAMTVDLQFDNVTDMIAAQPATVNGIVRIPKGTQGEANYACCVTVGANTTVTLNWQFDQYVTNYTTASGHIG